MEIARGFPPPESDLASLFSAGNLFSAGILSAAALAAGNPGTRGSGSPGTPKPRATR